MLLIMGCQDEQGYGIAKPMPADKIQDWIGNYQPNQEWLLFENKHGSAKDNKARLFSLIVNRWINRFSKIILAKPTNCNQWPILQEQYDHCAQWIKREQQNSLFDKDLLIKLVKAYQNYN